MGQHRILTKAADGGTATSSPLRHKLRDSDSSDALLDNVRALISGDDVPAARHLAREAVERHPGDHDLANAHRILNEGRSYTKPGTGRNTHVELEWLRSPA